jgi:uncharacterized membrane protein
VLSQAIDLGNRAKFLTRLGYFQPNTGIFFMYGPIFVIAGFCLSVLVSTLFLGDYALLFGLFGGIFLLFGFIPYVILMAIFRTRFGVVNFVTEIMAAPFLFYLWSAFNCGISFSSCPNMSVGSTIHVYAYAIFLGGCHAIGTYRSNKQDWVAELRNKLS